MTFWEQVIGITLLNGYGLTETSPVLAGRLPENNVISWPQLNFEIAFASSIESHVETYCLLHCI